MSLIDIRQLSPGVRLGLWRMDEPSAGTPRQREREAVRALLVAMTGDDALTVGHEPSGKPCLLPSSRTSISISHTRGYATVLLSDKGPVGVDIEYRSDRVERIAHRFLHPDEQAATTDEKLLVWSAKEAVYKLFSEDHLAFHDMRTLSIDSGVLRMENRRRKLTVNVSYEFTADYVLTYTSL